jgi:RsiW-degrading membrane proteinase PrsW (M82 family)
MILAALVYVLLSLIDRYVDSSYLPILVVLIILSFFVLWISGVYIFFSITNTEVEIKTVRKIISLLIVMGVLSAYFAMVINHKALVFTTDVYFLLGNSNLSVYQILYIYIIPIIEEVAKIFPVIILIGNYIQLKKADGSIHSRLTPSFRSIILYGAFFGAWFDFFEQFYKYSEFLAAGYSNSEIIALLVYSRSIFPLHMVMTMITAFGLGLSFVYREKLSRTFRILIFVAFLLLSSSLHGFWNYLSQPNLTFTYKEFFLRIMGLSSYALLAVFGLFLLIYVPKICSICNTEHLTKKCPDVYFNIIRINKQLAKKKDITPLYQESEDLIICSECQNLSFNGEFCFNCWSFPRLQCENCNQVVPAFTRTCWACGTETPTLYDKMTSSSPPFYVNISVGFTRILGVGMLISFIFAFTTLSRTIAQIGSLSSMGYTILLLGIMLAVFIIIFWYAFRNNKVRSMIGSMNILSIVAISIIVNALNLCVFAFLMIITGSNVIAALLSLIILGLLITVSVYYLSKVTRGARLIVN